MKAFPFRRPPNGPRRALPRQQGFALTELAIALFLLALGAVLAARTLQTDIDDSAAEATGRYLMQVRGALVELQVKHEAWLRNADTSAAPPGTYPTPPALTWQTNPDGTQAIRGGIDDLVADGQLRTGFPSSSPLGERAQWIIVRQGTCPGEECRLEAYVYSCHPISAIRSSRRTSSCTAPAGARANFHPALLGRVLQAAQGYGGHDGLTRDRFVGPLMNAPRSWFPISSNPGRVVLTAGLDATPWGQFVRQGDTRPIYLADSLAVAGALQTSTGLILDTHVPTGSTCPRAGMYAQSETGTLVVCREGLWVGVTGQVIQNVYTDLPNGASVLPPQCADPASAWRLLALQGMDVQVTGADVNVHGSVNGTISGSGNVNTAGSVSVSGNFSGNFSGDPSSSVRVSQHVAIVADRVVFSPPSSGARATVIQGCRG